MSLPRLRLEGCKLENGEWLIDEAQAHHLVRVRRCYSGSPVEGLLDGQVVELRLICDGDSVRAAELSRTAEAAPAVELHLVLALLKNDQLDDAFRFAAETGVSAIHILCCERSVPKISADREAEKRSRWNKILSESTKQAGAGRAPALYGPFRFSDFDFSSLPEERYAALLSPAATALPSVKIGSRCAVAIGPEGDWSPGETRSLLENGFSPISLGKRILRASTAVAVACGWFSNAVPRE